MKTILLINQLSSQEGFNSIPTRVSFDDNLCKQFGPRSDLIKCRARAGSKHLMVFFSSLLSHSDKVSFCDQSSSVRSLSSVNN